MLGPVRRRAGSTRPLFYIYPLNGDRCLHALLHDRRLQTLRAAPMRCHLAARVPHLLGILIMMCAERWVGLCGTRIRPGTPIDSSPSSSQQNNRAPRLFSYLVALSDYSSVWVLLAAFFTKLFSLRTRSSVHLEDRCRLKWSLQLESQQISFAKSQAPLEPFQRSPLGEEAPP